MKVIDLSVLVYEDKEVGYRLDLDSTLIDVSKVVFDSMGGVCYSGVNSIELYSKDNLIASNEEIKSGIYVSEAKGVDYTKAIYEAYKVSLGGRLIDDKYVISTTIDTLGNTMVTVSKLGVKDSICAFYVMADIKDVEDAVSKLSKEFDIHLEVYDLLDGAIVRLQGVLICDIEYDIDVDILSYEVKKLLLQLVKYSK